MQVPDSSGQRHEVQTSQGEGQNLGQFSRKTRWLVAAIVVCGLSAAAYAWISDPNKSKNAVAGTGEPSPRPILKNASQAAAENPPDHRLALGSAAVDPTAGGAGGGDLLSRHVAPDRHRLRSHRWR